MKLKHVLHPSLRALIRNTWTFINRKARVITASQRKLPNFLCIGAQKSGSSTLYWWLHQHPEISMSFDKESKFFDRHYKKGEKWYRHQFPLASSKKLAGDNTPYYLFHPLVPERAYSLCPKAKVIMVLRNPINRAFSQYQMERRKGREHNESFAKAIEGEIERIAEARSDLLKAPLSYNHIFENTSYLSRGIYVNQINDWMKFFPPEQLLIIEHESFFKSPENGLSEVYRFLNIEQVFPEKLEAYNVEYYDAMEEQTRADLSDFFSPYNKQLEVVLGKKFCWDSPKQ